MSADTLSADGPNRYAYVADNPMRSNDPTGHYITNEGDNSGYTGSNPQNACSALCAALRALYNAGITSLDQIAQNEAASTWAAQAPEQAARRWASTAAVPAACDGCAGHLRGVRPA